MDEAIRDIYTELLLLGDKLVWFEGNRALDMGSGSVCVLNSEHFGCNDIYLRYGMFEDG